MSIPVKLIRIGASLGLVLPDEAVAALGAAAGDSLALTPTPGGFQLTLADPELARQLAFGRAIIAQYDETLRALAK